MRILVLVHDRIQPAITGARVRNFYLWPALSRLGHEVRLIGLDVQRTSESPLGPPNIDAAFVKAERELLPARACHAALYSHYQWPYAHRLATVVDRVAAEWGPDVIHAEELRMAQYLPALRGRHANAFQTLTLHNVETELAATTMSLDVGIHRILNHLRRATLKRYERKAVSAVDLVFAYSPTDLRRYRELYPDATWSCTRNGANAAYVTPAPPPQQPSILVTGTLSYWPNIDGLKWLLANVKPQIARGVALTVAGSGATPEVRRLVEESSIAFADTPKDLAPFFTSHSVCAIPLLAGGGTRGRVLEALAHGRPVVTTTKGIEGLEDLVGNGVVVCDDATSFANELNHWSTVPPPAELVDAVQRGRAAVLGRYDWSRVAVELAKEWSACASR